ncbi:MAG: vitamin K epoxide reductase [Chloroflexi bacterium]|nr:vitamin K epoxide reductase [Chloroflexota bacterium]
MKKLLLLFLVLLIAGSIAGRRPAHAQEQPVVHAVLFYSPTCPHCHVVLNEGLPPLIEKYGDQLQILLINVTVPDGNTLYQATVDWLNIPANMQGVPTLVVGDQILVGETDIPARLPEIVDAGLASGGIDWPAIPGFKQALAALELQRQPTPRAQSSSSPNNSSDQPAASVPGADEATASQNALPLIQPQVELSPWQRALQDPTGSALAIIILVGMVLSLAWIILFWVRHGLMPDAARPGRRWAIPLLALAGMGIAFYMSFLETTHNEAICGPIGDCNAVQQSPYALLFGVLPVGVLGLVGFAFLLALWVWQSFGASEQSYRWAWLLPAATFFGVLFSAYLTFLEPFVIGAVCMWCLSSAVIMTALLWLSYRRPLASFP